MHITAYIMALGKDSISCPQLLDYYKWNTIREQTKHLGLQMLSSYTDVAESQ